MTKTKPALNQIFVGLKHPQKTKTYNEAVDYETAVEATGFGKFNIMLLVMAIPASWSTIFETSTMSYVFPAAQCDLELNLNDKGLLNSITYAGTITSAFAWGFLFDTFGRKRLMFVGFLVNSMVVIISSFSINFTMLMICKYIGGFIMNGPYAALVAYLSEFHSSKNRARVQLTQGILNALGGIYLPLLALGVLPLGINWSILEGFEYHSWNLYIFFNSLPGLLSGIIFSFMPESPKFLMTNGENERALRVFQMVYQMNTGMPAETYPIKILVEETKQNSDKAQKDTFGQVLKKGWHQIAPLFQKSHFVLFSITCLLMLFETMALNTLRLWFPQLFQAMNDYQFLHNGTSTNFCEMISILAPQGQQNNVSEVGECFVNFQNSQVYYNAMFVSVVNIVGYLVAGALVNCLGKKRILCIMSFIGSICGLGLYFAPNSIFAVILMAVYLSVCSIATNVILTVVIDLFPTTIRTMAIALIMMVARASSMVGTLVFPLLLQLGCAPPFLTLGSILFGCALLPLLLPNLENKALQ